MSNQYFKLKCPKCQRRLKVPSANLERRFVCPKCNTRFLIDEQLQVVLPQNHDLYGNPGCDDLNDDLSSSNADCPFDKVQEFIHHIKPAVRNRDLSPSPAAKTETGHDFLKATKTAEVNTAALSEVVAELSMNDASLYRNGVWLLILSIGLCLLPFATNHSMGLGRVLAYMPFVSMFVALVGSFMMAFSMRRGNLGAVLMCGLPFFVISLISLGGHFYVRSLARAEAPSTDLQFASEIELPDGADRIVIDRDFVVENPAAKFVPPQHDLRVLGDGKKPVERPEPDPAVTRLGATGSDSNHNNRPRPTAPQKRQPLAVVPNPGVAEELQRAVAFDIDARKKSAIRERIESHLDKSLISLDHMQSPEPWGQPYRLTPVAGRATVYGVAYMARQSLVGFDIVTVADTTNRRIGQVIPIMGVPEFRDSVAAPQGFRFVGLNAHFASNGLVGLQGVFQSSDTGKIELSPWVGQPANARSSISIHTTNNGSVYGIVTYKDKWDTVGLRLIESTR